jgi:hypothetical protein
VRIEVDPPNLIAAAAPLREAADQLRVVVDHRRDVLSLVDGPASPVVAEALGAFVRAWELVAWSAADDAARLALVLEQAAQSYGRTDAVLVRR